MPVISLLQDMMYFTKSPYERYIGKHTQQFCVRLNRKKLGEFTRKVLMGCMISADDAIAILLGLSPHHDVPLIEREPTHLNKPLLIKKNLKLYLSALLVLLSLEKESLLEKTALAEDEFIELWLQIFQYNNTDQLLFNLLLSEYEQGRIAAMTQVMAEQIATDFYSSDGEAKNLSTCFLMEQLIHDTEWVFKFLHIGSILAEQGGHEPVLHES